MYIYQRLKDLREDCDLTQKEIANQLNTSQKQYSRWETGEYEIPFHYVIKLAKYYNTSIDYIAGITNNPENLPKDKEKLKDNTTKITYTFPIPKITNKKTIEKEILSINSIADLSQEYNIPEFRIIQILEHDLPEEILTIIEILHTYKINNKKSLLDLYLNEIDKNLN